MSNKFREIFGLDPITAPPPPLPFIGVPSEPVPTGRGSYESPPIIPAGFPLGNEKDMNEEDFVHILPVPDAQQSDEQLWRGKVYYRHAHRGSFLRRIHRALMALGPWEGRAVAFVLGT